MPVPELANALLPFVPVNLEKMLQITPLIQERIRLLRDVQTVADFFFETELAPYDPAELIPKKGDLAMVFVHAAFVVFEVGLLSYMAVRINREASDADPYEGAYPVHVRLGVERRRSGAHVP